MPAIAFMFVKSRTGMRNAGGAASGPSATANETKFSVVCARCTNERRGERSAAEGNGGRGGRGTLGGGTGGGFRRARRDLKVANRDEVSTKPYRTGNGFLPQRAACAPAPRTTSYPA